MLYSADPVGGLALLDHASPLEAGAAIAPAETTVELATAPTSVAAPRRELVILGANVADPHLIVAGLSTARAGALEVARLDADGDALDQIGALLARADHAYDAVHLVTHASPGRIDLGSAVGDRYLDLETLAARVEDVAAWRQGVAAGGDFMLYGCDLAASRDGERLLAGFAALVGVDVAASVDPTGAAALGGDWDLEYRSGEIDGPPLLDAPDWHWTLANTAPAGADATIMLDEDMPRALTAADFGFSDVDGHAFDGVRIASLPAAGSLTLGGVAVTAEQVVTAMDIAANRLLFTPGLNANGANHANFSFRVRDDGGAATGGVDEDPSANTLRFDVSAVNDAPSGANATLTILEDTPRALTAVDFGYTDIDGHAFAGIRITSLPGAGSLTLGGLAVTANQVVSAADIAAGALVFTPGPDANGANHASFGFQVRDAGGTANGGVDEAASANTLRFDVTAVNDAPSGTDATLTILEDAPRTLTAADFSLTDVDANAFGGIRIVSLPGAGSLRLNGVAVTANQVVSAADLAANRLVYTPGANATGANHASFTFRVRDAGGTANGGIDEAASANTLRIDVTSVNDAPAGTNATITLVEDTPRTLTAADFGYSDLEGDAFAGVRIASLPGAGSLRLNGVAVTANQVVSAADLAANRLVYTPAANGNGANHASFTFRVRDAGGTVNGGIDEAASADTLRFDVTAVDDAPAGTDRTLTILEDAPRTLTAADFGYVDVDGNAFAGVRIVSAPGAGSLRLNGVAVTTDQVVSAADIAASRLVFTPALDANGANHASFTFRVRDAGGTDNGAVDEDPTANSLRFDVTAVNDAPAGTDATLTILEDTPRTLTAADFGFSDTEAHAFNGIRIVSLPGAGSLRLNGVAVTANQVVSAADLAANRLVYTPAANGSGANHASFTFRVRDAGGTTNGGVDEDGSANTLRFDVTAVNDAPAGADATITILEDTPRTLAAADFGFADPDAHAFDGVRIVSLPVVGSLRLDGVAVAVDQVVSAADIAANRLVFTPVLNAHGANHASFTFRVRDAGGTTDGGVDEDGSANTLRFDVTAVNDAPTLTVPSIVVGGHSNNDTEFLFISNRVSVSDIDSDLLPVSLTLASSDGAVLTLKRLAGLSFTVGDGVADASMSFSGTIERINAALNGLRLTPATDFIGQVTVTVATSDLGNSGLGGVLEDADSFVVDFEQRLRPLVQKSGAAPNYLENAAELVLDPGLVLSDADDTQLTGATVALADGYNPGDRLSVTAAPGISASFATSSGVLTLTGVASLADYEATLRSVAFLNTGDHPTRFGSSRTVSWIVHDLAGPSLVANSSLSITAVNDAPSGADATLTILEDTPRALTATDFGYTDIDARAFAGIRITSLPGAGSLTLGGLAVTANQVVSASDIAAGALVFTPGPDASGANHASFGFQVRDAGGTANGGVDEAASANTLRFDVTAVNDAPSGTDATLTILEDAPRTLTAADFGYSDLEGDAFTGVRIASLPGAGSLRLNGVAVTVNQVVSAADLAANRLVYTPAANGNGANHASFTFRVRDAGGAADGGVDEAASVNTLRFDVTAVNDAPAGTNATITLVEDTPRTLTAADFGYSDPEGDVFAGVRIASLPGAGSLRLNGVAVTVNQVVSAADLTANRLVYTPAANGNGANHASFTFRVRDAGGTANGGIDEDASANTLRVDVTSVNDAPAGADATLTILEDAPRTLTAADFGYVDVDGNAFAGVRIVSVPGAGSLRLNGVAVTADQVVSAADLAASRLVFTPTLDASGSNHASFTFQVRDAGGTANGGVDEAASANTLRFDVTAVNDAPSGTDATFAILEDAPRTLTAADFGYSDREGDAFAGARIASLPSAGSLRLNGVAVTANQVVSAADLAANRLVYTPAANGNGANHASFTFRVRDAGGTTNGGADEDGSANTLRFDVTAVNDAPAGADATLTILEDAPRTLTAASFGFADPDAHAFDGVRIVSLPGAGSLRLDGVAVAVDQVVSAADIAASRLIYTPGLNAHGANHASFTFRVRDAGGTTDGGVDEDASANTLRFDVTAVNDAPTGTDATVTILEDTPRTLTVADFGYSDVDGHAFEGVRIVSLPGAGSLRLNGVAVTANQVVSAADLTANRLVYTPAANGNGANHASFTFRVRDAGGTANGGIAEDASANTLRVDVTSVNDAPTGADATITILEDSPRTLVAADFGYSDVDGHAFEGVRITSLPGAGSLTLGGLAVTANQVVSAADLAAGLLVFSPGTNGNGANHASFSFRVRDAGGTSNGGVDEDASANTLRVDVTAVNDAPAGADATITMLEDTPRTLSAADFGYADVDGHAFGGVRITSLPGAGSLTLNGVAVTANQVVSAADLAANRLVYTPAADGNGANHASFDFRVRDAGGTANGGVDEDGSANTLRFDVTAVNDAPAGADATITLLEEASRTLSAADFGYVDVDGHAFGGVRITGLSGAGSLTLNGLAVTANQVVSAVDLAAGALVFSPGLNAHGANHASFTFRVRDAGGTANGGVDEDASANTLRFDVTAVNDAPAGADATLTILEDTPRVLRAADFGYVDVDGHAFGGVRFTSLSGAGSLTLNGLAVTANQVASAADLAAGALVFTPGPDANGANHASFGFHVRDAGGTANGGVDEAASANTLRIDVTAVNDAPAGADATLTILEDAPRTLTAADFGYSDPEGDAFAGVRIASLPGAGSLRLNGVAVTANQVVSAADIAANRLVYTPAANGNGANHASFTFRVRDAGGTANGGIAEDASANTLRFDVTSVNDAPSGAGGTLSLPKNTVRALTLADFGFSDPDGNGFSAVIVAAPPADGNLRLDGVAVVAGQAVDAVAIAAGRLVYAPDFGAVGRAHARLDYQVRDGGDTANGGADTDPTPDTLSIDVTPRNTAPAGSDAVLEIREDTARTLVAADFGYTDPEGHALKDVLIETLPGAGALRLGGAAMTAGQFVSAADIAAGRLVYAPASNAHGPDSARVTFRVRDAGGTEDAAIDTDPTPNALRFDVTPVNDVPVGGALRVNVTGSRLAFTPAQFAFSDSDGDPLVALRIESLPAQGRLLLDGVPLAAGAQVGIDDLAAGHFVFDAGDVTRHGVSFTFSVGDGASFAAVPGEARLGITQPPGLVTVAIERERQGIAAWAAGDLPVAPLREFGIAAPADASPISTTVAAAAPAHGAVIPAQPAASAPAAPAARDAADDAQPGAADSRRAVSRDTEDARSQGTRGAALEEFWLKQRRGFIVAPVSGTITLAPLAVDAARIEGEGGGSGASETRDGAGRRRLIEVLDGIREVQDAAGQVERGVLGSSAAASAGMSVGYVLWLLRGEFLLSGLLSSLPAWRMVDPLPVLERLGDEDARDDESLEDMLGNDDFTGLAPAAPSALIGEAVGVYA